MSTETARRRGRAPRTPQAALRTKVWMAAVLAAAAKTAGQVEEQFDPQFVRREGGRTVRPRKWDRYAAGKHDPSDELPTDPVAVAEAAWPGTAAWYRSPLWRALDPSPTSEQEVSDLLGQLDSLKGVLFRPSRWNPGVAVPAPIDEELVSLLASHGGLDALAAATLLARKAELIHSPELRDIALAVYRELQVPLLSTPPLSIHGPELFRFIDLTFKEWVYPDPGRRLQVVIFSDEVRKAVEDLDREEDPEA
jgi:hypothetical protein